MSWKSFACLAVVAALSAPAMAQPMFAVDADGDTLQVVVDAVGSVAVEVAIEGSGTIMPASADPADPLFDTPNPGNNPFTMGVTNGAFVDGNNIFISFGSAVLDPGTYDLWDFTGSGTAMVTGLIAQEGVSTTGLTATLDLGGGGGDRLLGDADLSGAVTAADITSVLTNFGNTGDGQTLPGDADISGAVTAADITSVLTNFGATSAVAVPEPTAALLSLAGLLVVARGRRV